MTSHKLSRQALYDLVWAKPMTKVAAELGLTGTGLKKVCDRNDVPTPDRGYWNKLAYGKQVRRYSLPASKFGVEASVRFEGGSDKLLSDPVRKARAETLVRANVANRATEESRLAEAPPAPVAEIAQPATPNATNSALHEIALRLAKALARAKPDEIGLVVTNGENLPGVRIAAASVDRATLLIDQFVRSAEGLGWTFAAASSGLKVVIDNEPLSFAINEKIIRVPHQPTAKELAEKARAEAKQRAWGPWPATDNVPSGAFTFEIRENAYGPLTRRFSDLKKSLLETRLDKVMSALAGHAALNLENRLKREEENRIRAEREAWRQREESFESREKRRQAFANVISETLAEKKKLSTISGYLDSIDHGGRQSLSDLKAWIGFRLTQIESLLSAQFLDISIRSAELAFAEKGDAADPQGSLYRYYGAPPELKFWLLDHEKELATSVSAYRWAIENKALPGKD